MSRIRSGELDDAPIWGDITTLKCGEARGYVDLIFGGFPCQSVSIAGKKEGLSNRQKSGLWSEFRRLVDEIRPRYAFVENVPGLLHRGMDRVLGDLTEIGYNAEWLHLSASQVGAFHKRERIFILAYTDSFGLTSEEMSSSRKDGTERRTEGVENTGFSRNLTSTGQYALHNGRSREDARRGGVFNLEIPMGNTDLQRCETENRTDQSIPYTDETSIPAQASSNSGSESEKEDRESGLQEPCSQCGEIQIGCNCTGTDTRSWLSEPPICRTIDDVQTWMDRIRCLGNSVYERQAETALRELLRRIYE